MSDKEYYERNRERILERNRKYHEAHREEILERKKSKQSDYYEKIKESKRAYYYKNKERLIQYQRDFRKRDDYSEKHAVHTKNYRDKVKKKVFDHYGNKCACCGETEMMFLSIDHINGGGNEHRRMLNKGKFPGGKETYVWLIRNNFPEGFQTLCMNCNCGRARNKGVCPHQKLK